MHKGGTFKVESYNYITMYIICYHLYNIKRLTGGLLLISYLISQSNLVNYFLVPLIYGASVLILLYKLTVYWFSYVVLSLRYLYYFKFFGCFFWHFTLFCFWFACFIYCLGILTVWLLWICANRTFWEWCDDLWYVKVRRCGKITNKTPLYQRWNDVAVIN